MSNVTRKFYLKPNSRVTHFYLRIWVFTQVLFFLSSCSHLFYFPDRVQHYDPQKLDLKPIESFFPSKDGTALFSWYFPAKLKKGEISKGTLIQFHGNGENLSSHFLSLVWLTDYGYNLFTFDYRGYGRSSGETNQKGTYLDALAALEKAYEVHQKSRLGGQGIFVVYGQSLGGVIAMRAIDDFKDKNKIHLLVLDSTFLSYKTVARRHLASHWATWLFSPVANLLISNEYGAEEALKKNKIRLLIIHDEKDSAVTFNNGQEIFESALSQKDFWVLDEGQHVGIFQLRFPENRKKFVEVLKKVR